jgi:hypothetical protein
VGEIGEACVGVEVSWDLRVYGVLHTQTFIGGG